MQTVHPLSHRIYHQVFNLKELETTHPPYFVNQNKKFIYEQLPAQHGEQYERSKVVVSKYSLVQFPAHVSDEVVTKNTMKMDGYTYEPNHDSTTMEWHVNFADAHLFAFYQGSLFAQDEMQVMEHPCLGSVREALEEISVTVAAASPTTRESGFSTPVLIQGAHRRVAIATEPNAQELRPFGLYGRAFARGSLEAVQNAMRIIQPSTISNIIAIEAPKGGRREYKQQEIADAFGTAFTGYAAAKAESLEQPGVKKVVVHTGNWGTGAFGGDKVLMSFLQLFAARVSQIDELVFHTFDFPSTKAYEQGLQLFNELSIPINQSVSAVLERIWEKKFKWGVGDGN